MLLLLLILCRPRVVFADLHQVKLDTSNHVRSQPIPIPPTYVRTSDINNTPCIETYTTSLKLLQPKPKKLYPIEPNIYRQREGPCFSIIWENNGASGGIVRVE